MEHYVHERSIVVRTGFTSVHVHYMNAKRDAKLTVNF